MGHNQWFWGEDENGVYPPFDVEFVLKEWNGEEYVVVGEYTVPSTGLGLSLVAWRAYLAVPLLGVALEDDWERPDDVSFTGAGADVIFVYRRKVVFPLYQYQLIFRQAEFDDAYRRGLLDEEYRKYAAIGGWCISHSDPDCFDAIRPDAPAGDGISREGWLCQAVEFGPSGCWPFPWWACPHETEKTIYFRGECSCDHFKDTLQPLGIPCYHLIKAKKWYGSTVPYCPYIQCP